MAVSGGDWLSAIQGIPGYGGLDAPLDWYGGKTPREFASQFGATGDLESGNFSLPDPIKGSLMPTGNDLAGMTLGIGGVLGAIAPAIAAGAGAAGAAGGGAAGTLMPAAIPETAGTLSGWGLTQTSPGVWEALNAAGAAGGAGAAGAGGAGTLMPPAVPESAASLSAQGLTQTSPGMWEALGIPSGGGLPNIPTPNMPSGGSPSSAPTQMPPASPATATPAGTPQGPAGAPQSTTGFQFVDDLIKQMKANPLQALGLGMTAASLAGGVGSQKTPEQVGQLGQLGAQGQQTAQRLLEQARTGQLSGPQQASLDLTVQNTKNQIRQYFANIGMSDSTAARQAEAAVEREALAMKEQFLNQALTQGLNALGIASGPLSQAAQYTLGQDRNLQQAFGQFGQAIGNLFGRSAATTQQPQQPQQATTSAQG